MDDTRPLGDPLPGWTPPPAPPADLRLAGRTVRLEPLVPAHAPALHAAFAGHDALWDYMAYGPFPDAAAYAGWIAGAAGGDDARFLALCAAAGGRPFGVAAFLRIAPRDGCIEIGHVCIAPAGQRSTAATEAMALMLGWAFAAGYRRCEWKCNALNAASRRAAVRLGFRFEGVFRQHMVVKGRNRDTAWYAVTDREWPACRAAFARWLDPANFDAGGRQRTALSAQMAAARAAAAAGG
jgi:RimJ/RimL family protein N-acetyltransferase